MRAIALCSLCFVVACSTSAPDHGHGGNGGNGNGGAGGSGGSGAGGSGGSGGNGGNNGCSDAAKLVYVIDEDGTLYSFTPNQSDVKKSLFTAIGQLNCPTGGGFGIQYSPFSMSVDRNAVAWVEYTEQSDAAPNQLFQVSTSNAACTATHFAGGQTGFEHFGMGFVSNSALSNDETLFIAGTPSVGMGNSSLGTLDLSTFAIANVANDKVQGDPELTGTGLAELWGFYPDAQKPRIAKLDKQSGAESNTIMLGPMVAGVGRAWAFAFWGGDFWVFLQKKDDATTTVYHATPAGLKDSWPTPDKHIVGAGVSTCAPTVPIS
jgi:hypothetical protein